jgi:caa(3)-type oxidase subunit IV
MSDHSTAASAGEAHGADEHHDHDWGKHLRLYWLIFGILMLGTALTVYAAYSDLLDLGSRWANITLGLLIATFKASCVGAIFMHLKGEKHLVWKFLTFTAFFFCAMVFLFLFAQSDPLPGDVKGNMLYIKK